MRNPARFVSVRCLSPLFVRLLLRTALAATALIHSHAAATAAEKEFERIFVMASLAESPRAEVSDQAIRGLALTSRASRMLRSELARARFTPSAVQLLGELGNEARLGRDIIYEGENLGVGTLFFMVTPEGERRLKASPVVVEVLREVK